ncbi:hypothetical protein MXAN_4574 [Myxococcus xanthus DK 1622]|uniref:Uncharacterized protein n=1 Tax=Myxococcus xanthus (strain DK1622) TaxID=246197 RepID=Q1D3N1_MYXXD|nr:MULTISPECIES: hypothetical protein [Myxococcus]ABF86064.1 hypothetical protein MXAN_4574 [Myxococcus xanthus DK 1622]QZZ52252.1 hypothetical protein MyxoNM_23860 [Myxococcus xanthus]SDX46287.1 hypothetical protein SAMN05444383_10896 [Myxococcus xanthus]
MSCSATSGAAFTGATQTREALFSATRGAPLFLPRMFDPPTAARALSDSAREEEPELLSASGELPTLRETRNR